MKKLLLLLLCLPLLFSCGESESQGFTAPVYYNLGVSYQQDGELKYAIESYTSAIELDNKYTYAYMNRGNIFLEIGNYKDAIKDFSRAISLAPNDALIYYNRGVVYDKLNDYSNAIDDYTRSITLDNYFTSAFTNRGVAKFNSNLPACSDFKRACNLGSCDYYNKNCK